MYVPILLMGDFNSRTGIIEDLISIDDVVSTACGIVLAENYIFESKHKLECLGMTTEKHNLDTVVNNNDYKLIELCKGLDMKIINGRFGNDQGAGDFTCQNASGKSVVDYAIASTFLFQKLINFQIDTFDKCLSDVHTPIWVTLKFDLPSY